MGRGFGRVLTQKVFKFQSPKMRFSAFWGLNLRTNECVFQSRDCSFQSVTQSIPTSNEQMKTKWHTLAGKQILHKSTGKLVKKWWNIAFTWLKQRKTSGPSWKHVSLRFFDTFFVYNVIQTSCFFFLEKKELNSISKKANAFCRPSALIDTPRIFVWRPLFLKLLQ